MSQLTKLPNIGKILSEKLEQVGITTPEQLCQLGSREAYMQIKLRVDPTACANHLYALEGAVQNIRWHQLSAKDKQSLKEFSKTI